MGFEVAFYPTKTKLLWKLCSRPFITTLNFHDLRNANLISLMEPRPFSVVTLLPHPPF